MRPATSSRSADTTLEVRSAHLLGCQVLGYKLDGNGSSSLQSGPHVRFAEPTIEAALRSAGPARQSLDSRVLGQYGTILMAGVAAEALLLKEACLGIAGDAQLLEGHLVTLRPAWCYQRVHAFQCRAARRAAIILQHHIPSLIALAACLRDDCSLTLCFQAI
eukprot:SM000429S16080  [mRNA]  locus=s429:29945:30902:+ [translate_table: standard]